MRSKIERLPKKLNRTKVVPVRAHERLLYCREYYFICKGCQRDVSRESFGSRPFYCLQCRPPKSDKKTEPGQKKLPRPIPLEIEGSELGNGGVEGYNQPSTPPLPDTPRDDLKQA